MKSYKIVLAVAAAAALIAQASPGDAKVCKRNYYSGDGHSRNWQQGVYNARGAWSYKVKRAIGGIWAKWSKANVRDESCDPRGTISYCTVEAYPCK